MLFVCILVYTMLFGGIKSSSVTIVQWRFIFYLHFSSQIEFDLKSMNREFLLFCKLLNKHSIQYFTVEL